MIPAHFGNASLRYVTDLFLAGVIYYQSRNIASFRLADFLKVLRLVAVSGGATVGRVSRVLGGSVDKRDVSGYLSLGWHLGLLGYSIERSRGVYSITKLGTEILERCSSSMQGVVDERCRDVLRELFSSWVPLRVLLKFFAENGFDYRKAVEVLGEEMRFWTSIMAKLGMQVGGRGSVAKPFNDFVMRRFFKRLIEELDMQHLAKHVNDVGLRGAVVWSRRGEPIIATGVASIVAKGRRVLIATYVLDTHGIEFVMRAASLYRGSRGKSITIVTHKLPNDVEKQLRKASSTSSMGIDIEIYRSRTPLHAKMYTHHPAENERNEVEMLLTSANLTRTSLFRNIELGTLLTTESKHLLELIESKLSPLQRVAHLKL